MRKHGRALAGTMEQAAMDSGGGDNPDLARFSRAIDAFNLMPLWERRTPMAPGSPCVPALWRYAELKPLLLEAARLITKRQAERRVLVLENPSLKGSTFITQSLYAGLQIILPGEIAASHRHSPSALRFIVEGHGAYSAVAGERVTMSPGDFIVTPNWSWHDHGNLGTEPVVWLDGLDTPFAKFFGAMFREDHTQERQPNSHAEGEAASRYGANLLPVDSERAALASPLLRYPYDRSRAALALLARNSDLDPVHGARLRYANPATGGHPFPTMAVFLQLFPAGFAGKPCRATDGTVYAVAEGEGHAEIGGQRHAFTAHDIFVVPPWCPFAFNAKQETVLFSYSDRAGQEALGFWRESRD
jgi:gentisate 1,2-dioxygenase